ncbi:MAG: hypothetical protein K6L76_08755 [Agarilytica sp.]
MNNLFLRAAFLSLCAFLSNNAISATQGTTGTTSTGTLDVDLIIPDLVRITDLDDIDLGTYTGTGTETGNDDMCVFRNGAGNYSVTVTTNKGDFRISRGSGGTAAEDIDFSAYWNDATTTTGRAALTYNTALTTQTGAYTTDTDCDSGGSLNANFSVEIAESDMQTKNPNTYSATVTIVIAPE